MPLGYYITDIDGVPIHSKGIVKVFKNWNDAADYLNSFDNSYMLRISDGEIELNSWVMHHKPYGGIEIIGDSK